MNTWSERVRARMKELGLTQEDLAHKLGVTRGAVTHYLAGRRVPPLRQFQKLAAILKADPAWLQFGTEKSTESGLSPTDKKQLTKKENLEPIQRPINLLTWEQVAEYADAAKILKDDKNESLPYFYTNKTRWYALRIKGDSMTSPQGGNKSFHEGEIIIVDPNKEAVHGDFVVAILPRSKEATFKQYVNDGGIYYLKPLNPQYPIVQIDKATHICGVVVGCINLFI